MNEFENNTNPQPEVTEQPATPTLTLEPDMPEIPEIPEIQPEVSEPAATAPTTDGFNAGQAQQPTPEFTQPQYSAPQFNQQNPQQYGQYNQYNPYNQYQQPFGAPQPQYGRQLYNTPPVGYNQKSRLAAALLAFIFGAFGVHNFYLGNNSRATIQLVVSIVGVITFFLFLGILAVVGMYVWAFIEGVQLISGSPAHMYDGNGVIMKD